MILPTITEAHARHAGERPDHPAVVPEPRRMAAHRPPAGGRGVLR